MSAQTEAVESGVKVGLVTYSNISRLIEKQFDDGAQVVLREHDYADHEIYVSKALMLELGGAYQGYDELNRLVTDAFGAVRETDHSKTRFWHGTSVRIGEHEAVSCRVHYPKGSFRPIGQTQDTFMVAIERRLRLQEEQEILGRQCSPNLAI